MEFPVTLTSLIFVVLLIVPGVVLKRLYFQGEFTKEFGFGIFADRLISSIFLGIIVQIISFLLLGKLYGFTYESIKDPITKLYKGITDSDFKIVSSTDLWFALAYLVTSLIVALALGWIAHVLVRIFSLDSKFPLLRFNNQWNYFFRGDIVHSKKFQSINKGKVIQTYIDVVLDSDYDGKKKMVSGFLTDYNISSKTGDLETLYITDTKRFSNSKNCQKEIEGDCFIIPYSKVIDMNLKYVFKEVDASRRRTVINAIYELTTLIIFFTICSIPWLLKTRLAMRFLIFWLGIFAYVIFLAIIGSIIDPQKVNGLKGKSLASAVIVFLFLVAIITKLTNVW